MPLTATSSSSTSPRNRRRSSRPGMPGRPDATDALRPDRHHARRALRQAGRRETADRRLHAAVAHRRREFRSARRRSAPRTGRPAGGRSPPARPPAPAGPRASARCGRPCRIASSASCVTITQVTRLSRSTASMSSRTSSRRRRSSPENGSSISSTLGRGATARAARRAAARRPTACADRLGVVCEPDAFEREPRLALGSARGSDFSPNITLARLVRCGNSAKSWNISPTPRRSGGSNWPPRDLALVDQDAARRSAPRRRRRAAAAWSCRSRKGRAGDDLARRDVEAETRDRSTAP